RRRRFRRRRRGFARRKRRRKEVDCYPGMSSWGALIRAPFLLRPALDYFPMESTRRIFVFSVLLAPLVFSFASGSTDKPAANHKYLVFVGTYTSKTESKGIYEYEFDSDTGKLTPNGVAAATPNDQGVTGPNKQRQEAPHAHWIETTAHNHLVYVADLGLDRVLIYKFDARKGSLTPGQPLPGKATPDKGVPLDPFSATLNPGAGPRHVAFGPDGKFMYVLGELQSTVTVFANDAQNTYRSVQQISTLPRGFAGRNDAAEIALHPNGKFLY